MNELPLESRTAVVRCDRCELAERAASVTMAAFRFLMQRLLVETKRFKKLGKAPKNYEKFCDGESCLIAGNIHI